MYTHVLNVTNLLRTVDGDPWIGPPAGTAIGHIHLHVRSVPVMARFYAQVMGFDVMHQGYPGAVFLAAGGYHHHIGLNTWESRGGPGEGTMAGLIEFAITVPDAAARQALSARLAAAGASIEEDWTGFLTQDPEGNRIRVG